MSRHSAVSEPSLANLNMERSPMPRLIITSCSRSLSILLALFTCACGYLDQEIHLEEEAYAATFESEGLSSTGYSSSGCGVGYGHRTHASRRAKLQRHHPVIATGEVAALATGDAPDAPLDPLLVRGALSRETEGEEEAQDSTQAMALNHELVTRIATQHAH